MRLTIEHTTLYRYDSPATSSVQSLRLTPQPFDGQTVIDWRIECQPAGPMQEGRDAFGNTTHLMVITGPHQQVEIKAIGTVDVEDRAGLVSGLVDTVPLRVYLRRTPLTEPGAAIATLSESIPRDATLPWLHALMSSIRETVDYLVGVTGAETTGLEAFEARQGVCQDHAHIFIAAARHAGIPTRYVTGYLLTEESAEAAAHHAWAEAWIAGLGWLGFDVANRICPTDRYVRLCAGLDARYAAPVRGSRRGGQGESLCVHVNVQRMAAQQ